MLDAYAVGDWIGGRFQVFDVHEGGMSLVYVVNDHLGGSGPQVVALKTLRRELLRSRIRIGRFAAECRLWVQLGDHPNVVRAHSVEIIDGRPYVVLELIQGGDLSRWIGTARLDLLRALRFGYQFCLGLEHSLRQGLQCHRDVKPGNLLVTEDGTLKITDFGLARVRRDDGCSLGTPGRLDPARRTYRSDANHLDGSERPRSQGVNDYGPHLQEPEITGKQFDERRRPRRSEWPC